MASAKKSRRLEESDAAVELDALHGSDRRRQFERIRKSGRKQPLEGEVVDGDHRRRPATQVGGRQPRLPIMSVHQSRPVIRHQPLADLGGGLGEGAEAKRIVLPIEPGVVDVRIALAPIKMRRVEDEELELAGASFEQPRRAAMQIVVSVKRFRPFRARRARRDIRAPTSGRGRLRAPARAAKRPRHRPTLPS